MKYPRIEKMKVADLRPADYNPRAITEEALAGLGASVDRFGMVELPVFNKRTGTMVGGHQRLKVMHDRGTESVDVVVVDLDDVEEKALNVSLNNPEIAGTFTNGLQDVLAELGEYDDSWMDDLNMDALLEVPEAEPDENEETEPAVPEPPKNPITKPGDIWEMGDHRIICGDCRATKDFQRVMDKSKINVAFTSPPYASQRKYDESSGFKHIPPDSYVEWFRKVQANVGKFLADDGSWFVNIKPSADGLDTSLYVMDLVTSHVRSWGWHFATEFCWQRSGVPKSVTQRFKNQFEPVYQFAKGRWKMRPEAVRHASDYVPQAIGKGAGNTGWGDARQGVGGDAVLPNDVLPGLAYPGNRLGTFGNAEAIGHTAAFPIGLPEFFIKAFSDDGDLIFDPFMGSGTTMIAAQKNGRRSAGCEISPAYCDVIVERWEHETGGKASRE